MSQPNAHPRHPLAAYIYTGRANRGGEVAFIQMAAAARLRTALGRVGASANVLSSKAAASSNQTQLTLQGTTEQQQETAGEIGRASRREGGRRPVRQVAAE